MKLASRLASPASAGRGPPLCISGSRTRCTVAASSPPEVTGYEETPGCHLRQSDLQGRGCETGVGVPPSAQVALSAATFRSLGSGRSIALPPARETDPLSGTPGGLPDFPPCRSRPCGPQSSAEKTPAKPGGVSSGTLATPGPGPLCAPARPWLAENPAPPSSREQPAAAAVRPLPLGLCSVSFPRVWGPRRKPEVLSG